MTAMTEEQAIHAMEVLARLYAEQHGFENPIITVRKKEKEKEDESA